MPDTCKLRVLVIGDAMIDTYKTCRMERISPEAPVPVLSFEAKFERLGGAANMAAGVVAMDAPCDLLTLTGCDAERDTLETMLADAGVGAHLEEVADCPTIVKERILAMNQQICRIDYEAQFRPGHSDSLMARAVAMLGDYGLIAVSDYDKGVTQGLPALLQAAGARGIPVLVDPKLPDWTRYCGAFLIKPNWKEFKEAAWQERLITPGTDIAPTDHAQIETIGRQLLQRHGIAHLVVTMGSHGYVHIGPEAQFEAHPTRAREVFDLSGAGDTFLATMTAFMARGERLEQAVARGNAAAGIAVSRMGTSVISSHDLDIETGGDGSEASTLAVIRSLAAQRRKIVFTNGCFDILHPGHLAILRQSKAAGDVLVVGLNSDASVARLKGPTRPAVPLEDRKTMLEGLSPVDFVIPFDEDTPARLIEAVAPDVLVKGGDYTVDTIVGADFVMQRGGKVLIVPTIEGRSSSNIIAKCGDPVRVDSQGRKAVK